VSIFEKIFVSLLNKELISSAVTWNTGMPQYYLSVFPKKKNPDKPTARHMQPVVRDPGFRKYAQTVPDMHKADPTAIQKVNNPTATVGAKKLSENELQEICKKYGITRLNTKTPKKIGNTGQVVKFDPNLRGYVIQ